MAVLIKLVVFSVFDGKLKIFLTKNINLPSGRIKTGISLDGSAKRIFKKSLNLPMGNFYLEQLYTFSESRKESRIEVVYYVLVPHYSVPLCLKKMFVEGDKLSKDSDFKISHYAVQRLQWKVEYTNVVYSLLPEEFTFSELQETYEAILGKMLDKRNFRKKILALSLLKDTGHLKKLGSARPAEMFAFKKRELTLVEVL